jgi:hypothetical protein
MHTLKRRITNLEAIAGPSEPRLIAVWKWDGAPVPFQDVPLAPGYAWRYQHPNSPTPIPPGPVKVYIGLDPTAL